VSDHKKRFFYLAIIGTDEQFIKPEFAKLQIVSAKKDRSRSKITRKPFKALKF